MVDISFHKHKESYGIPPKIRQKKLACKKLRNTYLQYIKVNILYNAVDICASPTMINIGIQIVPLTLTDAYCIVTTKI